MSGTLLWICHETSSIHKTKDISRLSEELLPFQGSATYSMLVNYKLIFWNNDAIVNILQQQALLSTVTACHNFQRHKTDNTV
jgi:hypothetical protein